MSQQDYDAGRRGETFQQGMNQISYEAGLAKYKAGQGQAPNMNVPKTEVDGVGFTMVFMAPLLAIMYPVAGIITVGSLLLVNMLIAAVFKNASMIHVIASIVVFYVALFGVGLKAEHAASRIKIYRLSRHILRLLPVVIGLFAAMTKTYSGKDADAAGAGIFIGFVILGLMLWIFPKLDRIWFPVMDAKTQKETTKYEGKNEDEVWKSKNLDWRNKKRFFMIWLVLTIGITSVFRSGVPVILTALISYGITFALRAKFKIQPEKEVILPASSASAKTADAEEPAFTRP